MRTSRLSQRELLQRTLARRGRLYLLVNSTHGIDLQARMELHTERSRRVRAKVGVLNITRDVDEAVALGAPGMLLNTCAKETTANRLRNLLKE